MQIEKENKIKGTFKATNVQKLSSQFIITISSWKPKQCSFQ